MVGQDQREDEGWELGYPFPAVVRQNRSQVADSQSHICPFLLFIFWDMA